MIVFNGNYVLEAALESVYPFASQIVIAEGPVGYFVSKGYTGSWDGTVDTIRAFPDPEKKIKLVRGQWSEKDDMVNAYARLLDPQPDFLWHFDSDEVYKPEDIRAVLDVLPNYDSVGFRSLSFYGGFDHILTGFEQNAEFERVKRWTGRWQTHRPPTVLHEDGRPMREHRHLGYEELAKRNIFMSHYSYTYPDQVKMKTEYYHDSVAGGRCIDDYFNRVYLPWVLGNDEAKARIEDEFDGVHDFLPSFRGACRTMPFVGEHPPAIAKRLPALRKKLADELEQYRK